MSEAIQKKAAALLKKIKQAEDDLGRTKHDYNWGRDAKLKYVKDRSGYVRRLEATLAKLREKYSKLEMNSRTHGGRRTRRRRGTRSTRRR
jgi:acyl-homoserine lactone acylase PvdQ